jgi:hypothetical protein
MDCTVLNGNFVLDFQEHNSGVKRDLQVHEMYLEYSIMML